MSYASRFHRGQYVLATCDRPDAAFDPWTHTRHRIPDMPDGRFGEPVIGASDDSLYVIDGWDESCTRIRRLPRDAYDPPLRPGLR